MDNNRDIKASGLSPNEVKLLRIQAIETDDVETFRQTLIDYPVDDAVCRDMDAIFQKENGVNLGCFKAFLSHINNTDLLTQGTKNRLLRDSVCKDEPLEKIQFLLDIGGYSKFAGMSVLNLATCHAHPDHLKLILKTYDPKAPTEEGEDKHITDLVLYTLRCGKHHHIMHVARHEYAMNRKESHVDIIEYACQYAAPELIDELIDLYKVNLKDRETDYIRSACRNRNSDVLYYLRDKRKIDLEKHADFICCTIIEENKAPLEDLQNFMEVYSISGGQKVDGTPLLHIAVNNLRDPELATFLIDQGADVDALNDEGKSALFYIGKSSYGISCNQDNLKTLLLNGANIDICDTQNDLSFLDVMSLRSVNNTNMTQASLDLRQEAKNTGLVLTLCLVQVIAEHKIPTGHTLDEMRMQKLRFTLTNKAHNEKIFSMDVNAITATIFQGEFETLLEAIKKSPDDYIKASDLKVYKGDQEFWIKPQDLFRGSKSLPKLFQPALWKNNVEKMTEFYEDLPNPIKKECLLAFHDAQSMMRLNTVTPHKKATLRRRPRSQFKR